MSSLHHSKDPGMHYLQICPFPHLLTHSRFLVKLRSGEGTYHSLILFRLSTIPETTTAAPAVISDVSTAATANPMYKQIYLMESSCPHLGADMSHADIEESEDESLVAVCPWHRYDFDLRTGKSETGLRACTYDVDVRTDTADGLDKVWIETPEGGTNWLLVELRPVSEEFADPPPAVQAELTPKTVLSAVDEPVVPDHNPPKTLMEWAVLILQTSHPTLKVQRTRHAVHLFRTGKLASIGHRSPNAPRPPEIPPRDADFLRNTVSAEKIKNRKNRALLLHALANVEQWAIDLAWDIMARFGPSHPDLPPAFFDDFTRMAADEAKHFSLLTSRLSATSPKTPYGSLPVHAALWESATATAHSLKARLAIIHLVHEAILLTRIVPSTARGLDVNPGTIARFRKAGDKESVRCMEIIHSDEVTHVTSGHRWFVYMCEKEGAGVDPIKAFREEVRMGWKGEVKGPFNVEDRATAGLSRGFYEDLRGELRDEDEPGSKPLAEGQEHMGRLPDAVPAMTVEYDTL